MPRASGRQDGSGLDCFYKKLNLLWRGILALVSPLFWWAAERGEGRLGDSTSLHLAMISLRAGGRRSSSRNVPYGALRCGCGDAVQPMTIHDRQSINP